LTPLATIRRNPLIRGRQVVRGDQITRTLLLILLMLFAIVPLLSMFTAALAPQGSNPPGLSWPAHPHWGNFADAWTSANLFALFRSSILIVLGVVPAAVAMATAAGYGLAQLRVPGGKIIYGVLLAGLTIPYEALITPLYYDIQSLGLLGSRLAVVLPLIGLLMPFGVFWMRAHFVNAETALTEAGQLDGGSTWQIFRRIHLPLAKAAISALTILFFLATWNQYLLPLVLIGDPAKRTVAGGLGAFQGQYGTNTALLCAGSLLIIAPSLVVFLVFQRNFVKALLQGAIR
jgi:raffinose/stachyose/melibiose transport system permease protein